MVMGKTYHEKLISIDVTYQVKAVKDDDAGSITLMTSKLKLGNIMNDTDFRQDLFLRVSFLDILRA